VSRRGYIAGAGAAGVAALAGCSGGAGGNGSDGGSMGGDGTTTINIITWEEYAEMQENIESTLDGVELNITPSTSSTEMFSQWSAGQDEQFDIAVPNNNLVPRFIDADLVAPVNQDVVNNYGSMYDKFQTFVDEQFTVDGNAYGVPIRFGWYGYSYDSRELSEDHEKSYEVLYSEEYDGTDLKGEVIMYDNHFKAMAMTALYLGYRDAFEGQRVTLSEDQIQEVKQLLLDQKPLVQGYIAPDSTYIKSFRQGNHIVGQSGRNEIMDMRREGDDWVRMAKPKEGELAWFEGAVVSSESDNQEMAWKVVNQYISPEVGAEFAKAASTPSCNPKSNENLSDDLQELFGFGPERLEGMIPFKAVENEEAWISAWEEVKAA
jgi:spermidine/putrescine transport system substrate-binding protein